MNSEGALSVPRVRRGEPDPRLLFLFSLLPAALLRCHQLKEDTDFQEFLLVHQKRTQVATWANDALDAEPVQGKSKPADDYLNFDSDSGQESEEEDAGEGPEGRVIHTPRVLPVECGPLHASGPACGDVGPPSAARHSWPDAAF